MKENSKLIKNTSEEIITYKFAATINDTKLREKFINGPLNLQLALETIESDNYNRKYLRQVLRRRANGKHQTSAEEEIKRHRQKEANCPKA